MNFGGKFDYDFGSILLLNRFVVYLPSSFLGKMIFLKKHSQKQKLIEVHTTMGFLLVAKAYFFLKGRVKTEKPTA